MEAVVDGDGHDRRAGQRQGKPPHGLPFTAPIQPHRLKQFVRNVADEVGQDQHRQRNGKGNGGKHECQQAVVQVEADDHQVDRDDGCLQRDCQSHQEHAVDQLKEPALAPDYCERGHEGDQHRRDDGTQRDNGAVHEVLREVGLKDHLVVFQGWLCGQGQRVLAEVACLRLQTGDHHVVDRNDDDSQPDPASQACRDV
ncbi:hypothetical protein D9M72_481290 [compost metagenome]